MEKENAPFILRELGPSLRTWPVSPPPHPQLGLLSSVLCDEKKTKCLFRDGSGPQTPGSSSAHDPKNGCVREPPWGCRPSQPECACPQGLPPPGFLRSLWGAVCMVLYMCFFSITASYLSFYFSSVLIFYTYLCLPLLLHLFLL